MQHHVATRLRAAGLEKAQVLRGDLGFDGKVELTHAPALAPFAQQVADGSGGGEGQVHARDDSAAAASVSITSLVIDCAPALQRSWPRYFTSNEGSAMTSIRASSFLRRVLIVDA